MNRNTPQDRRRTVAVIGAGPAGLATLKELKECGINAIAFDTQPAVGGVYASHYDSLQLTTSNLNTSFGAFPQAHDLPPRMWTRKEYLDYLEAYASHFELWNHIRLSTRVEQLRWDPCLGRWRMRIVPSSEHSPYRDEELLDFDHVALCCGVNRVPHTPSWPGLEAFRGQVLHSRMFRRGGDFSGRRVLVIGLGESGSDICKEVAPVARASAVSTRSGPGYLISRYYRGLPSDLDTNRCYHSIPRWLCAKPITALKRTIEGWLLSDHDDKGILEHASAINAQRGLSPFHRFGTKNTSFLEAVHRYGMAYKPDVTRFEPDAAVFADGTRFKCDTVIACTGYRAGFEFFSEDEKETTLAIADSRRLYKHMFAPSVGTKLALIGFVRPGVGSIPPCAEMQARYLALVLSGQRHLPSRAEMEADVDHHTRLDFEQYPEDARRLPALTDYLRFMEQMAEVIDCQPLLRELFFRDPQTWFKVLFGPITGLQYRLRGPGSQPELAREALRKTPTMPRLVLLYEFALLLGCKALHSLGAGERYRPLGF